MVWHSIGNDMAVAWKLFFDGLANGFANVGQWLSLAMACQMPWRWLGNGLAKLWLGSGLAVARECFGDVPVMASRWLGNGCLGMQLAMTW